MPRTSADAVGLSGGNRAIRSARQRNTTPAGVAGWPCDSAFHALPRAVRPARSARRSVSSTPYGVKIAEKHTRSPSSGTTTPSGHPSETSAPSAGPSDSRSFTEGPNMPSRGSAITVPVHSRAPASASRCPSAAIRAPAATERPEPSTTPTTSSVTHRRHAGRAASAMPVTMSPAQDCGAHDPTPAPVRAAHHAASPTTTPAHNPAATHASRAMTGRGVSTTALIPRSRSLSAPRSSWLRSRSRERGHRPS